MKKTLHILLFLSVLSSIHAQNTYFTEYFDDANAGQLTGTTASAPTTPTSYALTTGTWTFYYSFRAGSGCTPTDPNNTVAAKAIRISKSNATSPAGINPPAYMITPSLGFGVATVSWKNAKNTTTVNGITISKSSDGGNTWTPVNPNPVPTTTTLCDNYSITINDATVNKIRFENNSTTDQDIDNVTITSVNTILPVKFAGFSATEASGKIKLSWNLATEVNTARYSIERSSNSGSLSEVASMPATLSSSYNWIDNAPVSGDNFYRIRAIDKDGVSLYTGIVKISLGKKAQSFIISPNPVTGQVANIQLANFEKGLYTLKMYNQAGQQVYSKSLQHDGSSSSYSLQLPLSVKAGIYNLQIKDGETVINAKVAVQ